MLTRLILLIDTSLSMLIQKTKKDETISPKFGQPFLSRIRTLLTSSTSYHSAVSPLAQFSSSECDSFWNPQNLESKLVSQHGLNKKHECSSPFSKLQSEVSNFILKKIFLPLSLLLDPNFTFRIFRCSVNSSSIAR